MQRSLWRVVHAIFWRMTAPGGSPAPHQMKVLRGKRALVTGAASGIGRSIALALAREGVDLYLVDIDDMKVDRVACDARRDGVEVRTAHCDLAQPEQITALVESVLSAWGELNILVNNAGVAHRGPTRPQPALTHGKNSVPPWTPARRIWIDKGANNTQAHSGL